MSDELELLTSRRLWQYGLPNHEVETVSVDALSNCGVGHPVQHEDITACSNIYWIDDIKNDLGITVIMVEHDMSLVSRVSDRVLALNQGEVLALGTPEEVQSHPGVIEAYLGGADDDLPPARRDSSSGEVS